MIRGDKKTAMVETYSSVTLFSWGSTVVGKIIDLTWNMLQTTEFNALDTVQAEDTTFVWFPGFPDSTVSYKTNLLSLDGEYWISQESTGYRQNVRAQLLIMGVAT